MRYFLKKNNKILIGFGNAAIYNFSNKNVYLINKQTASSILSGDFSKLPIPLVDNMMREAILTVDYNDAESKPLVFQYGLFDDKYSYEKCKLAYLEITDVCNFNCIHCYANIKNGSKQFMTIQDASHYMKQISFHGPCDIRITGGEPFLNNNVCKIADLVSETVSPITKHSIVSNGSFKIEHALHILKKGFELQISIYGVDCASFCDFTKSSSVAYRKVLDNLEYISKTDYKDQVVLLFSVNAYTYKNIDTFKIMANKLGFRYILNRPASVGRATQNWDLLKLAKNELANFSKSQKPLAPFYCYHLCQLHWTSIMVNGDITPCGFLRSKQYIMGNLNNTTFADIWNCNKYNDFRKMSAHDVSQCQNCEFKFVCTAGCCGETASFTGDILNPYSGCQLKPYENSQYLNINDDELYLVTKNAAGIFEFAKRR